MLRDPYEVGKIFVDIDQAYEAVMQEEGIEEMSIEGGDQYRPVTDLVWTDEQGEDRRIRAAVTEHRGGYRVGFSAGIGEYEFVRVGTVDPDAGDILGGARAAYDKVARLAQV